MAEIILEPTAQSKVIPLSLRLDDTDTSLVSQLVTNRQFNTADTDAWFGFTLEGLAATTGTFDLTLINLQDKSVFNHTDKMFNTNPFYYKLESGTDELTNEIRHAGKWVGQLVVTLANGDSTTRKFVFGIEGHILDGTVVQTILLEDYNALITDIEASKDELTQYNIDYASLIGTVTEQEAARLEAEELRVIADALRETKEGIRQATFEANEVIRDGVVDSAIEGEMISQTVATKLTEKEATFAPRMLSLESELAEKATIIQYTQLGSISALKTAIEVDGSIVDINQDINLDIALELKFGSGLYSSNGSKINLTTAIATITVVLGSFAKNISVIDLSTGSVLPMVLLKNKDGLHDTYLTNVFLNGTNKTRNGINVISSKASEGITFLKADNVTIENCNDGVYSEVTYTMNGEVKDYGWINGNTFNSLIIHGCRRNIVGVASDATARSRLTGNYFNDLRFEPGQLAVFADQGNNIYTNVQLFDMHVVKDIAKNLHGAVRGRILTLNGNESPSIDTEQNWMEGTNNTHEIGVFTQLTSLYPFIKLKIISPTLGEKGYMYLYPPNDLSTNKNGAWKAFFSNQSIYNILTVSTIYDLTTDSVRVFIKANTLSLWGIEERRFFHNIYAPYTFTDAQMSTITTIPATKAVNSAYFANGGVVEKIDSGTDHLIRFGDGTQICYTDPATVTFTAVAVNAKSGYAATASYLKAFIAKPSVSISGRASKSDGYISYCPLEIIAPTTASYGNAIFKNSSEFALDRIIDLSFYAIGRYK